ncbi:aldehyde dehydrogenase family protein [Sphingosinicella microcystinivorans]|uniref:Aldehyde dehydrogenase n=1 Tax=Sphingosinicella microcystinivorans TaxID=335406 RepID=A0AAD1FZD2_SPHMI|nr:aldehyde dehydrogenase family protein [Sphingosinicella microcystinivorans]RKS88676.1 gamma-glutamyl-gamma-aminobutyraldehyde dehydrogenase [Sphingosinicella microcystinivorans]BBE32425.1 aldehyde dehydrogenase [Sphingosinicella microcystinivorans]
MNSLEVAPVNWTVKAQEISFDVRPWINGRRIEASAKGHFATLNPANGDRLADLPACGAAEIDAAVSAARVAFERGSWANLSPRARARILMNFADAIERNADELALLDTLEMGMPIGAAAPDMRAAADAVRAVAEASDKLIDQVIPNDPSTLLLNLREPVGVVGAITPWNFPAYIGITKIAPALAVGNSVVLKPSEIASLSCLRLGELAAEAGVPDGVLNIVPGLGSGAGAALASHMDVDLLTFTGSTATGKRLIELSAQSNMKRLILECGGKSPQIVFDDIDDLDAIADAVVGSITFNSGQVCVAGSRLLVERSIHDALVERVLARAQQIEAGDPLNEATSFGPLASKDQHARVRRYYEAGQEEGAVAALPRGYSGRNDGCYWMPTVFTDVRSDMRIAQEEIFGPVLSVFAFEDELEAVRLANSTIYGLAASVWTRDLARALRLARAVKAGSVTITGKPGATAVDATAGAFEPHGQSGVGVEGGLDGMRAFTRLKSVSFAG